MSDDDRTADAGGGPTGFDDIARTLSDRAVWAEPPVDLADRVVADITRARLAAGDDEAVPAPVMRLPRWRGWAVAGTVAAAAAALVLLLVVPQAGPRFELEATALAADATAVAMIESTPSGDAITLTVRGLAPAPAGSFYQAWVRGDRGLVSVGTFHMRGGDGEVELWSGVDVADYPVLSVTLEPEDGDQTSSGQAVLVGPIGEDG